MLNPSTIPFINRQLLYFLNALFACAVNVFFIITGYFSYKNTTVNIFKPIKITLVYCLYRFFIYLIYSLIGIKDFSLKASLGNLLPNSYFLLMYCTVILLCPYLNLIVQKLSKEKFKQFLVILLLLFSVWPSIMDFICSKLSIGYAGFSNIGFAGNDWGYNLVNFILCYYIGSFIAIEKEEKKIKYNSYLYFVCYLITAFVIFIFSKFDKHAENYCFIFVIFESIFLFLSFLRINIKNNVINFIAKSVWGIYALHLTMDWYWPLWNVGEIVRSGILKMISMTILCVISVFILCLIADKIFGLIMIPIYRLMSHIKFFNFSYSINNEK